MARKQPNWYGMPGIEFDFVSNMEDSEITYLGVKDNSCVVVEGVMWGRYANEGFTDPGEPFAEHMLQNADQVRELIELDRGVHR